jgi:hypothetical protein
LKLDLRKKLVKRYILSVATYDTETWTLVTIRAMTLRWMMGVTSNRHVAVFVQNLSCNARSEEIIWESRE